MNGRSSTKRNTVLKREIPKRAFAAARHFGNLLLPSETPNISNIRLIRAAGTLANLHLVECSHGPVAHKEKQ
jgi:hypothetical protein